uniref:Uncharacterized protein n=1 Tax=Ciona savignyi TaxID=51511 RepID=H2Z7S0_CIOSA
MQVAQINTLEEENRRLKENNTFVQELLDSYKQEAQNKANDTPDWSQGEHMSVVTQFEVQELNMKINSMQETWTCPEDYGKMRAELEELKSSVSHFKDERDQTQAEMQKKDVDLRSTKMVLGDTQLKLSASIEELTATKLMLKKSKVDYRSLKIVLDDAKLKLDESQSNAQAVNSECNGLKCQLDKKTEEMNKTNSELTRLNVQLSELKSNRSELETIKVQFAQSQSCYENAVKDLQRSRDEMAEMKSHFDSTNQALSNELSEANTKLSVKIEKLTSAMEDNNEM